MSTDNIGSFDLTTFSQNHRGAFATDYLNLGDGGDSRDTVVLGDEKASYYLADGWLDSVYIDGFDIAEDRLVLHGSSDLYTVLQNTQGSWITFNDGSSNGSSNAVAYLNGVFDFNLNSSAALYWDDLSEISSAEVSPVEPASMAVLLEVSASGVPASIDFAQVGVPEYQDFSGTEADDLLVGGDGADRLFGFAGNDYAFGGGGRDLFVLGDFGGSYYAQSGWTDATYIDDFTVGVDQLQLQGSVNQYSFTSGNQGAWLYCEGDAIAYLNGITTVDLNSFQYVSLDPS